MGAYFVIRTPEGYISMTGDQFLSLRAIIAMLQRDALALEQPGPFHYNGVEVERVVTIEEEV